MFDNYLYVSSTTDSFKKHFENAAINYINKFNLTDKSLVVDIGSNDGIALKPYQKFGINVLGVEPAKNLSRLSNKNGVETINTYFDRETVQEILNTKGKCDLVTASNVFAHSDKLKEITNDAFDLLKDDGSFIVEVQYLLNTINDLTFDNIYHEHVNYWSFTSIFNFFNKLNFFVYDVEWVNTHGGSIRVYVSKNHKSVSENVQSFLESEKRQGLLEYKTYESFGGKINVLRDNVINNFNKLKQKYKTIAGYGSPAKATTSLNFFGIDNRYIDYIIEDNSLKIGKLIPGVNLEIKDKNYCYENLPDVVIVLAWNFFNEIVEKNQTLVEKGVKFINIKDLQNINFEL
jgi:SAM-dependent methyltransferase